MKFLQENQTAMVMTEERSDGTYRCFRLPAEVTDHDEFLVFFIGVDADRSPMV